MDFSQLDMRISRTELKKAHERLQSLAVFLLDLPQKKWGNLPVSDYFLDELKTLAALKNSGAKNRQIKRVGKLMLQEDRHKLVDAIFDLHFDRAHIAKIQTWEDRLNLNDDSLKRFVKSFNASEYNSAYQLLLWIEYAKAQRDDELLAESLRDLQSYIKEVALLSTK